MDFDDHFGVRVESPIGEAIVYGDSVYSEEDLSAMKSAVEEAMKEKERCVQFDLYVRYDYVHFARSVVRDL